MGIAVNPKSIYKEFKRMYEDTYYVDKSLILKEFNRLIGGKNRFVCITRPRRFGKTELANMIMAYYGKEYDSKKYFNTLKIGRKDKNDVYENETYEGFINKYNVIFINFSFEVKKFKSIYNYIEDLSKIIIKDLKKIFPDIEMEDDLKKTLELIYEEREEEFIFVLDEWDFVFSNNCCSKEEGEEYLEFLRNLLKDKAYVAFAYMTGVLPVAKYSSGSALNMFKEFTMINNNIYSEYLGFTEEEVKELSNRNGVLNYKDLEEWYNGYKNKKGEKIFNPRSVAYALQDNELSSYWTNTGPMDEIMYYIKNNIEAVREDVVKMVAGESIDIELNGYSADKCEVKTRNEILSAMVVYGFLSYSNNKLCIPNKELMLKFEAALEDERLGYVSKLVLKSDEMLEATLRKDTITMTAILEIIHDTEIPVLVYNDENSLSCVITLAYLSARSKYNIKREDKCGKGFVDFIFYPYNKSETVIILELKNGKSAKEAIEQIHNKKYYMGLKEKEYVGDVLLVGINYDREKNHECMVEALDDN